MKLHRLRLVNFRQHADTEIAFGDGITGIIGPNGVGDLRQSRRARR